MYGIVAVIDGVEDDRLKNIGLPLNVAKLICGLTFAKTVANIRELDEEVIVAETDYSCHAICVDTGIEFEFRIEEVGA